jgi:GNAT superfamily N-acetyltransferase
VKEVLAGLALLAATATRAPLKVTTKFDSGPDVPDDEFALRAFHRGREVGQIVGVVQRGAMLTLFMTTRYVKEGRKRVGVLLTDKGETETIKHEDYSGRGVGKAMLNALVKEACSRGLIVSSHTDRSDMMEAFWRKQQREGRAEVRPAVPAFKGDQDYEYVVKAPCSHRGFAGLARRR